MAIEVKPHIALQWPPNNSSSYKVSDNENWASVAAKFNMTAPALIRFNFATDNAAEVNWYLHYYVGCPEAPDKKNRMFSSFANPGLIYYPTTRITMPEDTIVVNPRKLKARALVDEFAARKRNSAFPHLSRQRVADQLRQRIDRPSLINQGQAGLCPSAAVTYALALSEPDQYVKAVIGLFDDGHARIAKWDIKPCADLKNYNLPANAGIPEADWVIMASIRDSEKWFIDYQAESDNGGAWGDEVAKWLRKAGFTTVIEEWNTLLFKDVYHLKRADHLYRSGYRVCLLVHADVIADSGQCAIPGWTLQPNHWVVLASGVRFGGTVNAPTVNLTVFSWGKRLPIPQPGCSPVTLADFLHHYYGFVACKL